MATDEYQEILNTLEIDACVWGRVNVANAIDLKKNGRKQEEFHIKTITE